ncbi:MAG: peptidase domain-containing ABC transporter [Planctomycetota bacterium]
MWRRKPVILQHDETDCGPAVLAAAARYFGVSAPLAHIRELAGTDLSGTTLYGLALAAEELGFRATGVRAHWENLIARDIALPVIVPVLTDAGYAHFVLLYRVTRKHAVVLDPGCGLATWSRAEFVRRWRCPPSVAGEQDPGGALLVIVPTAHRPERRGPARAARLWALVRPHLPLLAEAMLCAMLSAALALGASWFVQVIVDRVVVYSSGSLLRVLGIGMVLVIALRSVFMLLRQYLLVHLAQKIDLELFVDYHRHLLGLPLRFFRGHRVGEIVARLDDAQKLRSLLQGTTLAVALDGMMFLLAAAVLFAYHARLAMVVFAFVPVFIAVIHALNGPVRRTERQLRDALSQVQAHLVETLAGIGTLKALGAESWARRQGETAFVKMTRAELKRSLLEAVMQSCGLLLAAAASLTVLWYGAHEVIAGHLSLGQLMFFDTLLAFLLGPMERLAEISVEAEEASVAADRVFEILEVPGEDAPGRRTFCPAVVRGAFSIDDVTFAYGQREPVLKQLRLQIPAGATVALVGESGSGKTTLANLLVRFDDPTAGRILLDGIDLRDWDLRTLRRVVSIVPQETYLFRGKVRENIALARPATSLEQIAQAARLARAHDFIARLPERFETLVGERAADLSGGQRQRVAIARALLCDPAVLILDEATSSLDSENEQAIQAMLNEIRGQRTTILIAHRLSTLRRADRIFVLHDGRVVEEGAHDQLIARRGRYSAMWARQLPGAEALVTAALPAMRSTGER